MVVERKRKKMKKGNRFLYEKHSVDATIVLGVVCHLRIFAPDNLATRCDQTKVGHVDLDDGTLGDHAKLRVHRALRVLLHADDVQAERSGELCRCEMTEMCRIEERKASWEQTSSARGE